MSCIRITPIKVCIKKFINFSITMSYEELIEKLDKNEEVYFKNTFEDVVFVSNPKEGYFVKQRNGSFYKIEIGSKILTEGLLEGNIITKDEFENFSK